MLFQNLPLSSLLNNNHCKNSNRVLIKTNSNRNVRLFTNCLARQTLVKLPNHVTYYSSPFYRVSLSDSVLSLGLLGSVSTTVGAPVQDTIYTYLIHPASCNTLYLPLPLFPFRIFQIFTSTSNYLYKGIHILFLLTFFLFLLIY